MGLGISGTATPIFGNGGPLDSCKSDLPFFFKEVVLENHVNLINGRSAIILAFD